MEKWIKYRTQIQYVQDNNEENQLTSLKEILKQRYQFNKDDKENIKKFEKNSIGP